MFKIILFVIFLLLAAAGFLWFKYPKIIQPLTSSILSHITKSDNSGSDFKRETVQEKSNNLLTDARVSAEQSSKDAVNGVKDKVYDSAKSALDIAFNKQSSSDKNVNVNVLGDSTQNPPENIFNIPLNTDTNLRLNLQRNKDYYLRFQNVPENFCLYINDSKYPLEDGKSIKITFISSGKYSIKANNCNLGDKVLGEFTVE